MAEAFGSRGRQNRSGPEKPKPTVLKLDDAVYTLMVTNSLVMITNSLRVLWNHYNDCHFRNHRVEVNSHWCKMMILIGDRMTNLHLRGVGGIGNVGCSRSCNVFDFSIETNASFVSCSIRKSQLILHASKGAATLEALLSVSHQCFKNIMYSF